METSELTPGDWEEQLVQYSLGTMGTEEAARFGAALEQCRARTELASALSQVAGLLGAAPSPVEPPEGHKARFMARIAATPREPEPDARPEAAREGRATPRVATLLPQAAVIGGAPAWSLAVAAVLVVALGVLAVWAMLQSSQQQTRIASLENEVAGLRQKVNIPEGYHTIALAPTPEYTGVSAIVLFNPEANEVWLVADGLKPLPDDLIYELWLIHPPGQGKSDVGGVFPSTTDGTAVHTTSATRKIADYAGFAVSIERKPGVPVREGPVVVVGRFTGE